MTQIKLKSCAYFLKFLDLFQNKTDAPKIRILHLTDIHFDLEYHPGSVADCEQPLCCHNTSSISKFKNNSMLAGYWGDYNNCNYKVNLC